VTSQFSIFVLDLPHALSGSTYTAVRSVKLTLGVAIQPSQSSCVWRKCGLRRCIAALFIVCSLSGPVLRAKMETSRALSARNLPSGRREEGTEYIGLEQAARSLGLSTRPSKRGYKMILADQSNKVEVEAEKREALVNGFRVFLGLPVMLRNGQLYIGRIDWQRSLIPLLRADLCGPRPPYPKVIAVDAGHGGVDHGAESKRLGLREKDCALDVALRLKKLLEAAGWRVVLTRDHDAKIELADRAAIANRAHADLFLSIHFNSLPGDTTTSGTEIFTFTPQFQRSTRSWSIGEGDDMENEISAVNRFDQWSAVFARALHAELLTRLKTFDRGKKTGHLGVLRGVNCPAVLVESAFLSNETEAGRIATPGFRQQIAEAILTGIRNYCLTLDALKTTAATPTKS